MNVSCGVLRAVLNTRACLVVVLERAFRHEYVVFFTMDIYHAVSKM